MGMQMRVCANGSRLLFNSNRMIDPPYRKLLRKENAAICSKVKGGNGHDRAIEK